MSAAPGGADLASGDLSGSGGGNVDLAGVDLSPPPNDGRIWPLGLHRSWTYVISPLGTSSPCKAGANSDLVTAETASATQIDYTVQFHCGGVAEHFWQLKSDGSTYLQNIGLYLGVPVQDNQTWQSSAENLKWVSVGSQTVMAGTFPDCWKAQDVAVAEHYEIYCRNVGVIRESEPDGAGNGYKSELASKSF